VRGRITQADIEALRVKYPDDEHVQAVCLEVLERRHVDRLLVNSTQGRIRYGKGGRR
jgi:hypothetical protein